MAKALDYSITHIYLKKHDKLKDKAKRVNIATNDVNENIIRVSPAT